MFSTIQKERRREGAQGCRLARSAFLHVPAHIAIPVLSLAALLAVTTDHLLEHKVWLGPVYLLLCAFSAWVVGSRFAIALGMVIISFNLLQGNQNAYPYGLGLFATNFILRFSCVLLVVLMLGQARKALEKEWRLARIDTLTGALTRKAFFEAIKAESGKEGATIIVFADINGLKRLNDEMGHELGDLAIRDFAVRIKGAIRENDLFARFGGDEFVIFMKVRDETAAGAVANRLNKVINLDAPADVTALKCSLGVLFLPEGSKSIDSELSRADKLMYAAKNAQMGLTMALPVGAGEQRILSFPLGITLPNDHGTAIRSRERQPDSKASPNEDAPGKSLAA
jgi:diguanylate cyclase (GGDEF)-like protein